MIYINQDGQDLGAFDLEAVQTGLQKGTFRPEAWAWRAQMASWRPLREVVARASMVKKTGSLTKLNRPRMASQTFRLL